MRKLQEPYKYWTGWNKKDEKKSTKILLNYWQTNSILLSLYSERTNKQTTETKMGIITNLYVIISAIFLTTAHNVGLVDKMIITSYIILQIWIFYLFHFHVSRGVKITFDINSVIQFILPTFLTILYFLNGFSLVFFSPSIRIF
jgi:hypothetical protein